jgi:DNA polymerase-3 subunit gamma/tau
MRYFCQELIDHFRNMTIIKAVGPATELPDLSEAELNEIREQAAPAELADLQRHMAILLKAENEMANTTFPRLVLEMALLKMSTLVPAVPVNEILSRLKALEGMGESGMIASPPLSWAKSPAGRDASPVSPVISKAAQAKPDAPPTPLPQSSEKPDNLAAPAKDDEGGAADPWEEFVAFVKGKKPMLASFLEHGHPLRVSATLLEIGFPTGSFQLSSLKDAAAMTELQGLAKAFFRAETAIRLAPVTEETEEAPATLWEKKSLEEANRLNGIKEVAKSHPMVAAALEIFGGEIADIGEMDEPKVE